MKKPTPTLMVLLTLTGLLFTPSANAAWPVIVWEGVKQLATEVAATVVVDYFKTDTTPEKVEQLGKRIDQLTAQLAAQEQAKKYPSESELKELTQLVEQLKTMHAAMANHTPLEDRVATAKKPVAQVWKQLDSLSTTTAQTTQGFEFKMNYVYRSQGQGEFKPLTDGTTLQSGDHYKIIFEPGQNGYAYLFQVDSAKQLYQLFPMQSFAGVTVNHRNPVKAGQRYYLPAKDKSFVLDNQKGPEKLYFTASHQPDVVLENFYQALQKAPKKAKAQLQTQLAQMLLEVKGPAGIAKDVPDKQISWQEQGQTAQVQQQALTDFCSNCINVLTFEHR